MRVQSLRREDPLEYRRDPLNPLQCSCLENPCRGAWRATVRGVAKSRTRLKRCSTHAVCVLEHLTGKLFSEC